METIELKECVKFVNFHKPCLDFLSYLLIIGKDQEFTPVITGAGYEKYPNGSYHAEGYAWDIRTSNCPDVLKFVCALRRVLLCADEKYRIVFGNESHTDHIHVEYRHDIDIN